MKQVMDGFERWGQEQSFRTLFSGHDTMQHVLSTEASPLTLSVQEYMEKYVCPAVNIMRKESGLVDVARIFRERADIYNPSWSSIIPGTPSAYITLLDEKQLTAVQRRPENMYYLYRGPDRSTGNDGPRMSLYDFNTKHTFMGEAMYVLRPFIVQQNERGSNIMELNEEMSRYHYFPPLYARDYSVWWHQLVLEVTNERDKVYKKHKITDVFKALESASGGGTEFIGKWFGISGKTYGDLVSKCVDGKASQSLRSYSSVFADPATLPSATQKLNSEFKSDEQYFADVFKMMGEKVTLDQANVPIIRDALTALFVKFVKFGIEIADIGLNVTAVMAKLGGGRVDMDNLDPIENGFIEALKAIPASFENLRLVYACGIVPPHSFYLFVRTFIIAGNISRQRKKCITMLQSKMTAAINQSYPDGEIAVDIFVRSGCKMNAKDLVDVLRCTHPRKVALGGDGQLYSTSASTYDDEIEQVNSGGSVFVVPATMNETSNTPMQMIDRRGYDNEDDWYNVLTAIRTRDNPYYEAHQFAGYVYGWNNALPLTSEFDKRTDDRVPNYSPLHWRGYQKLTVTGRNELSEKLPETGWFADDRAGAQGHFWWLTDPNPMLSVITHHGQ
jgi:hypothetical protein